MSMLDEYITDLSVCRTTEHYGQHETSVIPRFAVAVR